MTQFAETTCTECRKGFRFTGPAVPSSWQCPYCEHRFAAKPAAPNPILTFGIYMRKPLSMASADYLEWLLRQPWLRNPLKSQIVAHLESRPERRRMRHVVAM